jgi:diaminopimelate epimerase
MGIKVQCGNGGRCCLPKKLKVIDTKAVFNAVDGLHHASVNEDEIVYK